MVVRQGGFDDSHFTVVVTFVAGSLEAGGLPGSLEIPEVLK